MKNLEKGEEHRVGIGNYINL